MHPKLSIIVPIYNVEEYLPQCINSIIEQPFIDFELILVNDGSPDRCGEICDDYARKDNRIKVIHKINGGLSSARNAGIDVAVGDYFSFVDSDDFISNDFYYENMNKLAQDNDVDILVHQVCLYDEKENKVSKNKAKILLDKFSIEDYLMSMSYIGAAWINIYKKDIFKDLRFPEGQIFEDGYILTDIVKKTKKLYISDIGVYYYRNRDNSIMNSRKTIKKWENILRTHQKQLDYCYVLADDKRKFLQKYVVCHLALINAMIEFPNEKYDLYIEKFESYDFTLSQSLRYISRTQSAIKIYFLKIIGYKRMVSVYRVFKLYKVEM